MGTFTFEVWAINYTNTQSEEENGYCCDNDTVSDNCERYRCDNRFEFCLRNYGTSYDNMNNCAWGRWTTSVIYHNNDNFNFPPPMGHTRVPYHLSHSGSTWPVSVRNELAFLAGVQFMIVPSHFFFDTFTVSYKHWMVGNRPTRLHSRLTQQ